MRLIVFFFALFFTHTATADAPAKLSIPLQISGTALMAEVAHTHITRERGLMYRDTLEENNGMLFVFPHAARYSMWMLNTNIPLSVAFLDEKGIILNILDMTPHTQTVHSAAGLAKYALEMNQGWFSASDIKSGAQVKGLEQAPAAE